MSGASLSLAFFNVRTFVRPDSKSSQRKFSVADQGAAHWMFDCGLILIEDDFLIFAADDRLSRRREEPYSRHAEAAAVLTGKRCEDAGAT